MIYFFVCVIIKLNLFNQELYISNILLWVQSKEEIPSLLFYQFFNIISYSSKQFPI